MRPIKFKQAIYSNGKFHHWHYWGFLSDLSFVGPDTSRGIATALADSQQYTGLKDKNGTKIYEGDIVKDDVGEIGVVRFGKLPLEKSGDCVCTYLAYYIECKGKLGQAPTYECAKIGDWMEVIGSIHEGGE